MTNGAIASTNGGSGASKGERVVDSVARDTDHILIVGTGFAGLGMAIRLRQAGIDDFTILERAAEVGGTWRDNSYPGAACDVESHLYSFSFAPNPGWTRAFAPQTEILQYLVACTDRHDLRRHIRFNTGVTSARFDERTGVWEVETSDGRVLRARVLVSGCGGLSRPALPGIAGLGSFEGKTFHTARWDHSVSLEGRTVAVVGTGASAIQVVPAIAPRVKRLTILQRSAPWIMPKPDRAIGPRERRLFQRIPVLQRLARERIYWQREALALGFTVEPRLLRAAEVVAHRYLDKSVADPVLRAKLRPDYRMGCKRILPTNDYYPAVARDNVSVVTSPIDEVRPHGIRTRDGVEHPADTLVLATGFEAAEACAPFEISGRGGERLDAAWEDGAEAYLGTTVARFPNLFLIVGPNVGLGHSSMIFMIESQVSYILSAITTMRAQRLAWVDVRPAAQSAYNDELRSRLGKTIWASGCKSWYQTRSGKNTTLWPGFTFEFRRRTRRFDPAAYELRSADRAAVPEASRTAQPTG